MMLDLRVLNNLVHVAQEANFSRAAERLGLSQPALSRSIALLEAKCGVRLLDRGRTGVTPTPAGEELIARARRLLGEVSSIEHEMLMQSRGHSGRIKLGLGPLVAGIVLEPLLEQSLSQWPQLSLVVDIEPTMGLVDKVMDAELDLCICASATLDPNPALAITRLSSIRMGFFVRKGHPLLEDPAFAGPAPDLNPMANFPRMTGRTPDPSAPARHTLFDGLPPTIECDNFRSLAEVTRNSDAIWYASDQVVNQHFQLCEIVALTRGRAGNVQETEIVLVHLRNRTLSPSARQIVDLSETIIFDGHRSLAEAGGSGRD